MRTRRIAGRYRVLASALVSVLVGGLLAAVTGSAASAVTVHSGSRIYEDQVFYA